MSRLRGAQAFGLFVAAVAVLGCNKPEPAAPAPPPVQAQPTPPPPPPPPPFHVNSMDLGKAVGIDKKVALPAETFGPKDTIYVSVVSDGVSPAVVLRAKWTYGPKGISVNEATETIASLGPKATEFHIQKASGWPAGKYTVEVFADDKSVGTKQFDVVTASPAKKK